MYNLLSEFPDSMGFGLTGILIFSFEFKNIFYLKLLNYILLI